MALFFGLALFACDGAVPEVDGGLGDAGPSDGGARPDGGDGGGEPECMDECAAGSQSCDGTGQYRVCGQYDIDSCLEPSPPIRCAEGFTCSAGACVPPCRDECPTGSTLCLDDETVLTCGNFDEDACREPGGGSSCAGGERCERGACVDATLPCTDECASAGVTSCFGDAVRTCGHFDSDSCLDLGPPVACGAGDACSEGACVAYCVDDCATEGATVCVGDGVRTCGRFDADPCLDWGPVTACADGESCSFGACGTTCEHECDNPGGPVCTADGLGVATCGQFDSDECRDVSSAIYCPLGFECQSGVCVASCTNDCTLGATRCVGSTVQMCGDFDADVCLEWGGDTACPGGASCSGNACDTPCDDECPTLGATECAEGSSATRTCGQFDLDACREWSAPRACGTAEVCEDGACVLGPTPAVIVIHELLYDAVGSDTATGTMIFAELFGPPGTSLDGWELVGVDGNTGSDYNRIALDGQALGPDGWFVIAHPNGAPSLLAVADLTINAVDFQNGPDSVQLRWRGRVVDALGYGTFGAGTTFAGEGTPAAATPPGSSLTRDASHTDTDDNAADFQVSATPSPRMGDAGCTHECAAGATQCSGTQLQTCGDYDADPCREWSAPVACPTAGHVCSAGACGPPACTDECSAGQRQCSGSQVQTCGNYDADACLEWSGPADCSGAGEVCSGAGVCAVPCSDECPATGTTRCAGTQIETCGNHDADSCLEWSAPAACPMGELCSGTSCRDASAPEVVLIAPMGTLQTTQGNMHRMVVDATPAPGRTISSVRYYANGMLLGSTTTAPHEWTYTVPAAALTGSTITLQASAVDNAGSVGWSRFAYLEVRNDPPVASFTATITNVSTATVDASASSDTETPREMLEVCWDWDNDGSCDTPYSTTKITTHDFGASGTFTIGMTVRDAAGQTARTTRTVTFTDIQYVGGVTLMSTLWYGTVIITGDVTVPAGETLTVAPGTNVLFVRADLDGNGVGDYTLIINGSLVVNGTEAEPVLFSGQDAAGRTRGAWDRIRISGSTPSMISHAIIEYADVGLEIRNGSSVSNVVVRETRSECIHLNNGDNATLTDVTTTRCGGNGVTVNGGSTGVTMTRHTSTENGADGIAIAASSAVTASGGTFSANTANGATTGTGSTFNLTGAVVETNGGVGLLFQSTSGGTVRQNQIRTNAREGVGVRSDASGDPSPVITSNNIYSNATVGSTTVTAVSTSSTLTASHTCCSTTGSTSSTYTAPTGRAIHRVHINYTETDGSSYVNGYLIDASTGATLRTFTSNFSGWVVVPAGVTRVRVRVADSGWSSTTDTIVGTQVELLAPTGNADVAAATLAGTVDMRRNFLGTFPNVLSRVSMTRNTALNLHGFVGVLYDETWDPGPYKSGALTTQTWSGTVYVTGSVTIAAGQTITLAAGTQVQFVDHDQNGDGAGDFSITASGRLDAAGTAGSPVVITAYGTATADAYQSVILAGSSGNASTWAHVNVDHGLNAVRVNGSSTLSNVVVTGGSGNGIMLGTSTGARLTDVRVIGAGQDGVNLSNADNATLTRVTSEMNGGDGIDVGNGSTGLAVSYAMVRMNGAVGLRIAGGSGGSITDSTIRENGAHGVRITDSSPTLDYNLITYNSGVGIWVEGSGSPSAQYNIIKFNDDAGLTVWTTSVGSPTPTFQYSNVYGNAIVGTSLPATASTSSTLTASHTCCSTTGSTSSTYTAPAGTELRRVHINYSETDGSSYVNGYLIDGVTGSTLRTFTSNFSGWVNLPPGITRLRVRVADSGWSSTTDTIVGTQVEHIAVSTTQHFELAATTDTGTTLARYNYWTSSIADVPSKIHQSRTGAVDYMGFTGIELPSGSVTQVGPRP